MFQDRDGEREILLGNKQLLGIFFVLAILFGVFFIAGYMVGHSTGSKNPVDTVAAANPATFDNADGQAAAGETHAVIPDPPDGKTESTSASNEKPSPAATTHVVAAPKTIAKGEADSNAAQGLTRSEEEQEPAARGHHTYLQVAALKHSEAQTVAKILSRKGFHAQISPKAGTSFYRVLVGPVHNAGELNATRAALKNKGFREVFVQHL
ncbi:MAG TPA: SPOR domain-containing protein [Bryobacteraceae bacterium]|nr:SPOR domain-containing protein [Bryobacteraceae bacterium]